LSDAGQIGKERGQGVAAEDGYLSQCFGRNNRLLGRIGYMTKLL